ncbi:MAG TPA: hypothetical protein VFB33_16845 [Candidatus Binataceae bacterium]|nr:hypothetical protein [Candidatus Binataceae bacterium]
MRLLAAMVAAACTAAASTVAGAAGHGAPLSASARWRAVVISGAAVAQFVGVDESHLEVLAVHDGRLEPIPFQVDERLADGEYALPDGPQPVADDSPGILDRDDEIAMMLSDLGDRAGPAQLAKLTPGAFQIEAFDSLTGVRRYAYIAAAPVPRLSPVRYVHYDAAAARVEGAGYRMVFRGDFPIELALKDARGEASPSLIEGSEVHVSARVLMVFKLRLSGEGVTNRVLAWHLGPIRLIRRVAHSVKLILGIQSPQVVSREFFYRDYAQDAFVARVLWLPRVFFGNVRVRTWLDFVGLRGFSLFWSGMNGQPLRLDDPAASVVEAIQRDPPHVRWLAMRGGGKTIVQTFLPSPDLDVIRPQLYYCDGTSPAAAAAQGCTGATLQVGYLMTGWENLAAGTHRLNSLLLVLPDDADPSQLARELTTELAAHAEPAVSK